MTENPTRLTPKDQYKNANNLLHQTWSSFGGKDGTEITLDRIRQLLKAENLVGAFRATFDGIAHDDFTPDRLRLNSNLDTMEGVSSTIELFKYEQTRNIINTGLLPTKTAQELFGITPEETHKHIQEHERRAKACSKALEVLDQYRSYPQITPLGL